MTGYRSVFGNEDCGTSIGHQYGPYSLAIWQILLGRPRSYGGAAVYVLSV